jgi:hypothetical protein
MTRSREEVVSLLRRVGMADLAVTALATLPDPVDDDALMRFCAEHGVSAESLRDVMGGSP